VTAEDADGKFLAYFCWLAATMFHLDQKQTWRQSLGWLGGELLVVFVAVSAAFVVENYRDNRKQIAEMQQVIAGIVTELTSTETKARSYSDAILADIARWEAADRTGKRAVPGYYRIPGVPHPPSAAWNSAVASGIARMLEPSLRWDLGYFYSEFVGIHDNYVRYNEFTEREVLPNALLGPDAFYGRDGRLLPSFRVHMDLQKEFAGDLLRLSSMARDLRSRLEAVQFSE
jgi:hypothetical protein